MSETYSEAWSPNLERETSNLDIWFWHLENGAQSLQLNTHRDIGQKVGVGGVGGVGGVRGVWCSNIKLGMVEASDAAFNVLGSLPSSSSISPDGFTSEVTGISFIEHLTGHVGGL
ncbi:hypothetical protein FB451DRAFT_1166585 [Mycena latifolia]|nr:hypothetical protein FB451DRAFT_1166585 [Mycena latifolia]